MAETTQDVNGFGFDRLELRVPSFIRDFRSNLEEMEKLVALWLFKHRLRELTRAEREFYFDEMVDLYRTVLRVHYRNKQIGPVANRDMKETFVDFLRIALACEPVDSSKVRNLIRKLKEALQVNSDFFLELAPPSLSEYILSCVSGESWWDIRGSKLLMRDMELPRLRCIVLLKHGFPYMFKRRYFYSRCCTFENIQLKGEHLPEGIIRDIWKLDSLRLQMAVEILTAVFHEHCNRTREILSLMWKTVPHPFISSTEMFHLMSPFFVDFPNELRDLCEEYVKCNTVFRVPEVTSPRSLLHLSRIQVRKNLLDANCLSNETIEDLDIPCTLKEYLKLLNKIY